VNLDNNFAEIVIVSYQVDIDRCTDLVKSIRSQGFLAKDIKITVVVNDEIDIFDQHVKNLQDISNVAVYHGQEFGVSRQRGWWTQQWIKLEVSKKVSAPWYIVIDSDQRLWADAEAVGWQHWFVQENEKILAYYKTLDLDEAVLKCSPFVKYWNNAETFFEINFDSHKSRLLNEKPPTVFHTDSVRKMLSQCDKGLIVKHNKMHEVGLYWAFLIKENLINDLYRPFDCSTPQNLLQESRDDI
jgi:hypothetical protein